MSKEQLRGMKYSITFGVALACAMLFTACENFPDSAKTQTSIEDGYGKIGVSFAGEEAKPQTARTVLPSTVFYRYTYTFTKAGEQNGVVKAPGSDGFFTLEIGSYTVSVQAYTGNAEPTLAATGQSLEFSVGPGNNAPVEVVLTGVGTGAQGEFSYTITYPAGAAAEITLQRWPELDGITLNPVNVTQGNGKTQTLQLGAGSYLLTVLVRKTGLYAGISEAVRIYPSLATAYTKNYTDSDLLPKAPGAAVSAPTLSGATQNSITINSVAPPSTGQAVEYGISTSNAAPSTWQTSTTFSGLSGGVFYIFARSAENGDYTAGTASASLQVIIVTTTTQWNTALTTIGNGGSGTAGNLNPYTIIVIGNVAVFGVINTNFNSVQYIAVTLKGSGSLSLSSTGSILRLGSNQTLVIDDENLTLQGRSSNSYAVIQSGGALELKNGIISGNSSSSNGGGVYLSGGTFAMSGGTISGNTVSSSASGGGVYVSSGAFTMSGGTISGNTAGYRGGGVYVVSPGSFAMSGGTVYGSGAGSPLANTASGTTNGAALYVASGTAKYGDNTNILPYTDNQSLYTNNTIIPGVGGGSPESDYTISGTGTFTYNGSPKTATVTRKENAPAGEITVLYNETETLPVNVGAYTVTFNVAAAPGFSAMTGLRAGTITITITSGAAVNAPTGTSSVTNDSITINPVPAPASGQTVEYAINTSNSAPSTGWQASTTFSGLTAGTTYRIFARSAQNNNYNAGTASSGYSVTTHSYGISLNPTTHTFTAATYGYGAQSTRSVTVSNTGNQATGALTVALSGANADSFTLSATSMNSIAAGGTGSFTVVPKTGLSVSATAYTATVTVSGSNSISASLSISFTVNRATGAAVNAPTGTSSVSGTSITINAVTAPANGQTVEYAINTSNSAPSTGWQTSTTFGSLTAGTAYYFFARSAENTNYNAGTASSGYSVTISYGISLNPTTHTFTAAAYGYGAQTARTVTITNTGNQATGALTVALSGTNASSFTLSATSINSIAGGGNSSFTVVPNTGLGVSATAYTATVTVSGSNSISASLSISFTVNRAAGAAVNAPSGTSSVSGTSITINAVTAPANGQTVEYAKNTSNSAPSTGWQSSTTFGSLTAGTTYYFFARSAQSTNYNAGTASSGYSVTTHSYGISLNPTTHTFTAATYGYGAQSTRSVTVSNNGNQATGALTVALSGTNASSFTLSATSINGIAAGGTGSFTVVPKTGLGVSATAYTATVTVSGSNSISASLSVSFTVNRATGAAVNAPTGTSSVTNTSITINAVTAPANGQTVEYAKNTSNSAPSSGWQSSTTFSGLSYVTTYYFFARSAQSTNYNAGTASSGYSVTTIPAGTQADPFPLTANVWRNGSFSTPGGETWYSFTAAAGTGYSVWWNDSYAGDGSKTLNVRVIAYDSNGTALFDEYYGGWSASTARTINLISGGTVYLRVIPRYSNDTGTFAIGYSTGSRPVSGWEAPANTALTANQWTNGSITTSGGWAWYSFTAAANTTYGVWWNDSGAGDGSKTMDVQVRAYNSNGTVLFDNDSSFAMPSTIKLSSGGTVYLRVTSYGTGTFGIMYGAGIVRPDIGHTPLTANAWKNGSFATPGGVAWYSFTAAAGTGYSVWWNDSYAGDGSKTLNVRVIAYDSNGTALFDEYYGGWSASTARTINLISGGTVYLRVIPRYSNDTGTFAIAYSTSSTRP